MTDIFSVTYTSWATVILPLAIPLVYTYAVPDELKNVLQPGTRVEVEFGKSKRYAGIIKEIIDQAPAYKTKPVLNVLDAEPLLYPQQLKLWKWISEYYMCSEGEVMAAALPTNFKLSSESILIYNEDAGDDFSGLSDNEYLIAEALLLKKQLHASEVQQIIDNNNAYPVIRKLIDKKICFIWEKMHELYAPKKENFILLHPSFQNEELLAGLLNDWKGAPKQMELLLSFLHLQRKEGDVSQTALLKKSGATSAQLKSLAEKNILIIEKRNVDRINYLPREIRIDFELSEQQQICYQQLKENINQHSVTLLHGVTGSGKTLLYIKLIEEQMLKGEQVLYLLPEIALTTQIIRRLQKHFGGNILIYHSKFNNQERVELWNKVRSGEARIILGARSSLLLPFKNLKLIIVDEEHDSSYKQQDPAPRYNARDTAIYYASLFDAKVVLGSATPSLESYMNAKLNKYGFVLLKERFGGILLPEIEIIHAAHTPGKGKLMMTLQLEDSIKTTLENNQQVILFQNRRGYNPYLICKSCGFIPQCTHCDVSLTMHKYSNKLHCHYCGSTFPKLVTCPACGSHEWMEKNFGTEKIEEQLEETFSKYKVARMDVDSVRGKMAHDNLIRLFEEHRLDILVGTQMVVKGLDFDHVNLVGILDADGLLNFTDFRVFERAFQLMEQVSGRAGRKHARGKVIIQALNVKHPVLQFVLRHDYESFYDFELENRRLFFYPPFSRMIIITLKHKDKELVKEAAHRLAALLKQDLADYLTGPAVPVIGRLRNQYIMELMIRLPKETGKSGVYKKVISSHIHLLLSEKKFSSVHIIPDVDPN